MGSNPVGALRTLALISLVRGLTAAGGLGLAGVSVLVSNEPAPSSLDGDLEDTARNPFDDGFGDAAPSLLDGGFAPVFGGVLVAQSLIVGFASFVTRALLPAVSEGLRMLYAIAGNSGTAPD